VRGSTRGVETLPPRAVALGAVETSTPTPLRELTTLRLGGPAARIVEARDEAAVVDAVGRADRAGEPLLVLAGGSNVVVADEGFPGTVLRIVTRGIDRREVGDARVRLGVQAGEPWDALVERCVADGLAGVECLSGIPGSVGATPIQNVGAYGQEVAETIRSVRVLDRARDAVVELDAAGCGFSYRSSAFKRTPGRWVVLAVTFELERSAASAPIRYAELARRLGVPLGDRAPLAAVREAVLELRRGKGMVIDPADPDSVSAGSFFTNPVLDGDAFAALERRVAERLGESARAPAFPDADGRVKTSAAWLIERAGFERGHGDPRGIAISAKHTLALTNRGAGTTAELVALAREIAGGVRDAFGVDLVPEPVFVGHAWDEGLRPSGRAVWPDSRTGAAPPAA
jgi:UDP-N-acetylmuramate dehydrogenase